MDASEETLNRSAVQNPKEVHKDTPLLAQIFQYWDAVSSVTARNSEEERLGKKKSRTRRKDGKKHVPTLSQIQKELFGTEDQGEIRKHYKAHFLAKGNRVYVKGARLLGNIGDNGVQILRSKGLSGQGIHWQLQELVNISELSSDFIRRKVLEYSNTAQFDLRFDTLVWEQYFLEQPQEKWSFRFKLYMRKKDKCEDLVADLVAVGPTEMHKADTGKNAIEKLPSWTIYGASYQDSTVKHNSPEAVLLSNPSGNPSKTLLGKLSASVDSPVVATFKPTIAAAVVQFEIPPKYQNSDDRTENDSAVLSLEFFELSKNVELSAAKRMQYLYASLVFQAMAERGNDFLAGAASVWLEDWFAVWNEGNCHGDRIVIRALGAHPCDRIRLSEKEAELVHDGNQLKFVPNKLLQFIVTNCFGWDVTVRENLFWISDLTPVWNIVVNMSDNEIDNRSRSYFQGLWEHCLAIIPVQHGDGLWSMAVILNLNTVEDFVHSGPFPSTESRAYIRYFGPAMEAQRLQKRMVNILIQTLPGRKYHLEEKYRKNISIVVDEKIMEGFDIGGSPCGLEGNMYNILRVIYVLLEDMEVWEKIVGPESALYFILERVCISHIFRIATVGVSAAKTMGKNGLVFAPCQPFASILLTELRQKNAVEACGVDLNRVFSRQGMEHFLYLKEEEVRKLQDTVSSQYGEIGRLRGILESTNGLFIQNMKETGRLYSTNDCSKMLIKELEESCHSLKRKNSELSSMKKRVEELMRENAAKQRRLDSMNETSAFPSTEGK